MASTPRKPRKMVGLGFTSPGVAYVVTHSIKNAMVYMVDGTTDKKVLLSSLKQGSQVKRVCIVAGVENLLKLGKKPKPRLKVVVCDTPERLAGLSDNVELLDSKKNEKEDWYFEKVSLDTLNNKILLSGYTPVVKKQLQLIAQSQTTTIPMPVKSGFDARGSIAEIFNGVKEDFVETAKSGVYKFISGLSDRRNISGLRRSAVNRVKSGVDVGAYKQTFVNLQNWMESDSGGRRVSAAYQLCARQGLPAAVAASRAKADMGVLIDTIRYIPPSKKQKFVSDFSKLLRVK